VKNQIFFSFLTIHSFKHGECWSKDKETHWIVNIDWNQLIFKRKNAYPIQQRLETICSKTDLVSVHQLAFGQPGSDSWPRWQKFQ